MCFICFASLRNFGHTRLRHPCLFMNALLALRPAKPLGVQFRRPCLACPSRCTNPCHSHNPFKSTATLAPRQTLPKPHYPSKIANTLASLVKGRWIDGKAQTVALLLSACDMPTLFILQTFLPSRRRDCSPSAPSIRFSALSSSTFPNTKIRH